MFHALTGRKKTQFGHSLENEALVFATAFLLGQGMLANLWILLGLGGWFSPIVVKGIVAVAALSGLPFFPNHLKGLWLQVKNIYRETRSDSWAWQIIALLGVSFCIAGVSSLGAPLLEDSANFYMTQPKIMAETHRYQLIPFKNLYYRGGFQGEMNHAALMSLGSADAARLYSWITLLAGTVLLLGLCKRAGAGRRGQWMALAMIMTSSMIHTLLGKGKVDLFQMAMGLSVYYWMTYESAHARRISGLLAGFAVLGKTVYAVTLLPGMFVLLVWQQLQKYPDGIKFSSLLRGYLKDGLELAFWGGVTIFPMFIYNFILFDNPLMANSLINTFWGWGGMTTFVPPHIYVTAPLYLTFGQITYGQLGNVSVLVLMFLPMAVWMPLSKSWRGSVLTWLTASAFAGYVAMAVLFPTLITAPRYYMACLLLFIPVAVRAAEYMTLTESHPRLLTFSIQTSLIIVLLSTLIENTQGGYYNSFFFKQSIAYLKGDIPECGLERWTAPRCRALSVINKQANLGDRVLSNVSHNYYLRSDLLLCANIDHLVSYYLPYDTLWTLDWDLIFREGYRFIVVDKFYTPFPIVDDHPEWVEPVNIFSDSELMAYRLEFHNPPGKSQVSCQETQKGVWQVIR